MPPNQYREEEEFYPLQLRYILNENPANLKGGSGWQQKIAYATDADISAWMELVHLVIDGFPHLDDLLIISAELFYFLDGTGGTIKKYL